MTEMKPTSQLTAKSVATLLVVDDDPQLRGSLVALFQRLGLNVLSAPDGNVALNHLFNHSVDLVITDIFMADCDGLELLRMLRQIDPKPAVVAMSGAEHEAMPDFLRVAKRLGADRTISKPFQPAAILQLVEEMLGGPFPQEGALI